MVDHVAAHVGHERDVETERWDEIVSFRTLISAERTPTCAMTVGTAEIRPGSPDHGISHRHADPETYYVLSGTGEVHLDGVAHAVEPGSVVFVPADAWHHVRNTAAEPLRLLYVFAVDRFSDVEYVFPATSAEPLA